MKNLLEKIKDRAHFAKRWVKLWWQRRTRGWDDSATWNFETEIARWIAPRLKRFKEINNGYPSNLTEEKWDELLDEMIWTFEYLSIDQGFKIPDDNDKRAEAGLKLFAEYYRALWW